MTESMSNSASDAKSHAEPVALEQNRDSTVNPSDSTGPFVQLTALSRVFRTKSTSVPALTDVTISIEKGQRVALLGRSGSGKSTLLNLLAGLDQPTSGQICVDAADISHYDSDALAAYRLSTVGIVFQAFNLIPTLTALQNVELPFAFAGVPRSKRSEPALLALDAFGLKERASHLPSELSGGEQQRVAVARALVNKPSLILADEPTGNLDSKTAVEIIQHIAEYSSANQTTVVLVTHDEELATDFADRTIRLKDGKVVSS